MRIGTKWRVIDIVVRRQRRERREVADDALAFVLSTEAVVSRVETDVSIASEIEFVALTKL